MCCWLTVPCLLPNQTSITQALDVAMLNLILNIVYRLDMLLHNFILHRACCSYQGHVAATVLSLLHCVSMRICTVSRKQSC